MDALFLPVLSFNNIQRFPFSPKSAHKWRHVRCNVGTWRLILVRLMVLPRLAGNFTTPQARDFGMSTKRIAGIRCYHRSRSGSAGHLIGSTPPL